MVRRNNILVKRIRILIVVILSLLIITVFILIVIAQIKIFFGITPILLATYVLIGLMGCFLTIFSVMEVKEYLSYYRNLKDNVYRTHRLTYEQVMDNENRKLLLESILEQPGIHYNLLRKKCNLHPGQFRWHIDVLLDYEIIKKQRIGNHIVFFPITSVEDNNFDVILKFPLRDEIYNLIVSNPGIIPSEIARKLKFPHQRNKIKYHVDKLILAKYVTIVQEGNKKKLYPINMEK